MPPSATAGAGAQRDEDAGPEPAPPASSDAVDALSSALENALGALSGDQADTAAKLLTQITGLLRGARRLTPELIGSVFKLLDDSGLCASGAAEDRCNPVCDAAESECRFCSADARCGAAARDVCGPGRQRCRRSTRGGGN